MFKRLITKLVIVLAISLSASMPSFSQSNEVNGEVLKINKEQGKITLRHGPIKNLDMDQMTMVFRMLDPKLLDVLSVGDKVKFEADRVNGQLTVTKIKNLRNGK